MRTLATFAPWHLRTFTLLVFLAAAGAARAAAPDLTVGTTRYTVDRTYTYNLGPTGLRGWIYTEFGTYNSETSTGFSPWQILVTSVGTGTPASAAGILTNDVILGVRVGGGTVTAFTNNTRMSLGWAIGGAEASDGVLRLLVNRYGVATNQTYTLQLKLSNLAYSATAPYNCAKSARILADAVTVISNMSFSAGYEVGNPVLGLAKLAVGITNATTKAYANSICPATGSLQPLVYYDSWEWGYKNIFLTEYFLLTGDTSVTNGIREFSSSLGEAMSLYGTMGHHFTENRHDGTPGSAWGYGPMIACSIPPGISLVLAKKCGIAHPEIDPAIDRLGKFINYYVDKGGLPYGEHEPEEGSEQANNGKPAMATFFYGLQGNMTTQTEYYARRNMAEYNGMECWHCGGDPNYIWDWIGANVAGTNALAARLAQMQWYVDLGRRYDGSFVQDWYDQGGSGGTTVNYWDTPTAYSSWGLQPSSLYVLLFSVPNRRIYLTGRNPNPTNVLSAAAVSNAIWAGRIAITRSGYTTNQLLGFFSEYDPKVRWTVANEVATRPGSNTLVRTLLTMITNDNPRVRGAACQALGTIKSPSAITALVARLYDQDMMVRKKAGAALTIFDAAATAAPHLTNIMTAFVTNGSLGQYTVDWADPLRMANNNLAALLFSQRPGDTIGAPTNLLYDAVKAGLSLPDGYGRGNLANFLLSYLTWTHVQTLASNIVVAGMDPPPADRMFGNDFPIYAMKTLAKFKVEEGIPLAVRIADKYLLYGGLGNISGEALNVLSNSYRGAAKEALPALNTMLSWSPGNPYVLGAIYSINNLAGPALTNTFKNITAASATPTSFMLPTTNVALSCFVTDKDQGIPYYVWSKTQGVGNVTFTPNSSTAASNSTATFSVPGTYVIRMACVDKSILNTTSWQWGYAPAGSQTYTNILGAVYTNFTIRVYASPFVDITNASPIVTDFAQVKIGGTNNAQVVGSIRVVSMTGSTTNYTGTIAAATPWTIMVSNLVGNMTNIVTVSGTNGMGVATNDTILVYRTPIPFLQITNTPAGMIILPSTSNSWRIAGTNNAWVVGWMAWTNASLPNAGGRLGPAGGNWSTNVPLRTGFNTITVSGTNYNGAVASDIYTVCVGSPPGMKITNLVTTSTVFVPSAQATIYVAGTNNMIVGGMIWSNSMGGGAQFLAASSWNFTASLSNLAYNVIKVWGTNTAGTIFADTATVYRGAAPYVDIITTNFTIPFYPVARADIGVTNIAAVGNMWLASVANGVTNYTETAAAISPWTVTVSNLAAGATNYVTVTITNVVGMLASDTIEIYRMPVPPPQGVTSNIYHFNDTGTWIQVGWANFLPWLPLGALPGGSILRAVYADVTMNNAIVDSWTSDLLLYFDTNTNAPGTAALLQIGGDYNGRQGTVAEYVGWNGGDGGIGTRIVDSKTYGVDWTNQIDLANIALSFGNMYGYASWTGSVTIVYDVTAPATMASFGLPGNPATIVSNNIYLTVPYGTDMTNLAPTYTVSSGTCVPASGSTNDFTAPVVYTVTDWDLFVANAYTVTVTMTPASTNNDILTFNANVPRAITAISGTFIYVSVPYGTVITNIAPTYTLSPFATCDPASGWATNFTGPVVYSVLAQDLSEKDYIVYVTVRPQVYWPVTDGISLWMSGDTINPNDPTQVAAVETNMYVRRWPDLSGNGQDATQTANLTNTEMLVEYVPGDLNGYPTLRWITTAGTPVRAECLQGPSNTTIQTVFFVVKHDGEGPWHGMFESLDGSQTIWSHWWDWIPGTFPAANSVWVNGAQTGQHAAKWHIARMVSATSPSFTYLFNAFNWKGRIAEWMAYNRELQIDEIALAETYLSNKYFGVKPGIDITNITGFISITNTTQEIAGTNDVVGGMWWTNSMGGGGVLNPGPGSWSFMAPVQPGNNVISVFGTNGIGSMNFDSVTVNVVVTPYVDITNDDFSVNMTMSAVRIGGTNNAGPIGSMWLASVAGGVTNYTAAIPASMSWKAMVSNLVDGVTNYVTVTATNGISQVAGDSVQIYRRPIPFVGITNPAGGASIVSATNIAQYVAGTNSPGAVGDLWWANSLGGGGVLNPAPRTWNFTTPLCDGTNVITISGTNTAGEMSSATVTVTVVLTPGVYCWTNTVNGVWSGAANWSNEIAILKAPALAGQSNYVLNFNEAGTYVSTHDLNNGFALNQLNFGGATVALAGNSLFFSNNGALVPQVNQNSAADITINNALGLGADTAFGGSGPGSVTVSGPVTGAGGLTKASSGRLALTYGGSGSSALADGGIITYDGMYVVHTFTNSGTFTPYANMNVEVLVVGGGGAGGGRHGGGGAGGGVVRHSSYAVSNQAYTVVVGNGGFPSQDNPNYQNVGSNGENSVFADITALGGGGGGSYSAPVPTGGGSGGGGGGGNNQAAGLSNQTNSGGGVGYGNNGGAGTGSGTGGGGGGGASTVGRDAAGAEVGGDGGTGIVFAISGSNVYYAGGGGGGGLSGGGTGGPGGGGTGGCDTGTAGTPNTGGGGGGVRSLDISATGKQGGSGIVIMRYLSGSVATYQGDTVIGAGTLAVGSSNAIVTTTNITIAAGAKLEVTNIAMYAMPSSKTYTFNLGASSAGMIAAAGLRISNGVVNFSGPGSGPSFTSVYIIASYTSLAGTNFASVANLPWNSTISNNYQGGNKIAVILGPRPVVDITNVAGSIVTTNAAQYIAGTNNTLAVGWITWTNVPVGVGGRVFASSSTGWTFIASLQAGYNYISVRGTNTAGILATDSVTVFRTVAPFVDITNANFTVGMGTASASFGGTNNPAVAGGISLVSMTGSATNYAASIPATTPWTATVNNLIAGATNFVTITGTNGVGHATNDTIQIYRRPIGIVDITNLVGIIVTTNATEKIVGTNNLFIVGGMWWTNSAGGGGTFPASSATGWSFTVTLMGGTNIITVRGTNTAGDVASDSITNNPPSMANDILTCIFGVYSNATIVGTNISKRIPPGVPLTNLAPTFTISPLATINPPSGSTNNFTSPVTYTVTAQNGVSNKAYRVAIIPDPQFTLLASTNLWDGRSVMTVTTNLSNWAAMLSLGVTNFTYNWSVAGVAVTKVVTPGMLTLTLAQGSGPMTVKLVMDNGGAKITNSVVIQVQEPTNEAWIVRTPDANEKPTNMQFYARDDSGYGTLYYNGTIGGSPSSVFITIYTNNGVADVVYTNISKTGGGTYAFTAKIKAGLVQYKLQFRSVVGGVTNLLDTVDDLVCGDAYIVDGQSNAVTVGWPIGDSGKSNKWLRSYGRFGNGWNYACRLTGAAFEYNFDAWQIGYWEYEIASNLMARYQVPICMINGAIGGTRIDQHMPGVYNAISETVIFDTLSNRVALAKLTHGIRGFFWHQGENDSGNDGPDGTNNYFFYQQYFVDMSAAWKQACPNIRNYFIYQVFPRPCGMGPYGDQLREVQRTLPKMFSPRMRVMSTVGLSDPQFDGCHYGSNGYRNIAYAMLPLVEQDIYGAAPGATNTAPSPRSVSYTSISQNQIAIDFGQTMIWNSRATNMFYLDNVGGKVTSGSVTGSVMYLQLSGYTTNTTITYLKDQVWDWTTQTNKLLYGANGIAALTFADVPIGPSTAPPFVNITNADFAVGMYVTNTVIGGTNNATVVGFMRLSSVTGGTTNYTASIAAATPWTAIVSNLVDGATNVVTMTATNNLGVAASDTILIFRAALPNPGDVQSFAVDRGAEYGQMQLSWSNGSITVLACTNRLYSTNAADWFVLSSGVATPWTHTAASNFPSVYYRIVSGSYTSQYAVGKYDINIAPGSIAWLSFPFGVQAGCDIVSEWFGQQLEARYNSSYDFPSLQRQSSPGGTIEYSDYYIADLGNGATNWFPTNTVVANAGYVLFLPQTHGGVKVTGIGMVQTNNVTMQLPYNSIPWVGLAYDVVIDMRQSGLTNMLQPPRLYSTFNYDFVDSQQTPGGPIWYAEYYQDNWGGNSINFFPSATGADKLEPGKGYLLFFGTGRAGTGTWTCIRPY